MTEDEAREIIQKGWGTDRTSLEKTCFGTCCTTDIERVALATLILGAAPTNQSTNPE